MRRGLAQLLPHLYSLLRECRTKFPDKVLGVLNIDLAKRVIQYLHWCRHRQQCLAKAYTSDKGRGRRGLSIHIADTQPAPFADGRKQKCCSSECSGEKAERGPLTFLRKVCSEVPDDLDPECESRQSRSTLGPSRNQLPTLDLRIPDA